MAPTGNQLATRTELMSTQPDPQQSVTKTEDASGESPGAGRDVDGWAVAKTPPKSPVNESTPKLVAMLAHAILGLGFNRIPLSTRRSMVSIFGMIALLTPLALWVSWSQTMLLVITGIGVLSVGILLVIVWLSPEDEL